MKKLLPLLLAGLAATANATGNHKPQPTTPAGDIDVRAGAWSGSSSGASALGGAGGTASSSSGFSDTSRQNFYVLPAPVGGTPLPPGMCARSKSSSFAIGWNFLSVANADSHTDMECLDLLVRVHAMRAAYVPPAAEQRLTPKPGEQLHPPKKPKVVARPLGAGCGPNEVAACVRPVRR